MTKSKQQIMRSRGAPTSEKSRLNRTSARSYTDGLQRLEESRPEQRESATRGK